MRRCPVSGLAAAALLLSLSGCSTTTRLRCGAPATLAPVAPVSAAECGVEQLPAMGVWQFENLVLEGGGVKGIAYVGAVQVLHEEGVLGNLKRVAGTSAGSIMAAFIALRYPIEQLEQLMMTTDFTKFEDDGDRGPVRLAEDFGWYSGQYFRDWVGCQVEKVTGNAGFTFQDLHAATNPDGSRKYLDLYIVTTDLSIKDWKVLSHETVPCMPIAEAVRMSGSLPLVWNALREDLSVYAGPDCSQKRPAGATSVFVDGGVLRNYPLDLFDRAKFIHEHAPDPEKEEVNGLTLGLHLNTPAGTGADRPIDSLPDYVKSLFETILGLQVDQFEADPCSLARSAQIDDLGIPTADFNLTEPQKRALICSGRRHTGEYLQRWRPDEVMKRCQSVR
ncbi:MAG TPA: patatin-like phospholipase family protein [Thermoanaerobaculia bacterium]|nr:patatin-like phospholipase family protein [Thermoanaerobaculia bacterium]